MPVTQETSIMPQLKKLPIGIQTFAKIREANYLYVDKTGHIADMVENGTYYFLSRPRRFGKSLLVSTLQALFERHEKFSKGLLQFMTSGTGILVIPS